VLNKGIARLLTCSHRTKETAMSEQPRKKRSMRFTQSLTLTFALALATTAAGIAAPISDSHAQPLRPDALLQIDLNRSSVVDKIVESWKNEIPAAQIGAFRSKLSALRADQLLAANVSGSFDSVLEIVHSHSASAATTPALGSAQSFYATQSELKNTLPAAQSAAFANINSADAGKALGDPNADLVYTPITPCRLFDTRTGQASALGTVGGQFSNQQTKTITPAGACGIPTTGVASLFLSFHAFNNNPALLGVIGFMKPAAPFSALAATWTGANWATGTYITQTNPNGSFDAFVGNGAPMTANMVVDVMGYFKAPGGVIGDITEIQTAAGSGLTGGTASGVASLALANTYKLPQACANGQVAKYNTAGSLWECQNDNIGSAGGSGTVTSVATGIGLAGGPITAAGTVSLANGYVLPQGCTPGQIPKSDGNGTWSCAAAPVIPSFAMQSCILGPSTNAVALTCSTFTTGDSTLIQVGRDTTGTGVPDDPAGITSSVLMCGTGARVVSISNPVVLINGASVPLTCSRRF
jgi:hypothetical protein